MSCHFKYLHTLSYPTPLPSVHIKPQRVRVASFQTFMLSSAYHNLFPYETIHHLGSLGDPESNEILHALNYSCRQNTKKKYAYKEYNS